MGHMGPRATWNLPMGRCACGLKESLEGGGSRARSKLELPGTLGRKMYLQFQGDFSKPMFE